MAENRKDLLYIKDLSPSEIEEILCEGNKKREELNGGKKEWSSLRGKSVVTLFYENSTRTRVSFNNAAAFLGAYVRHVAAESSSIKKGESLDDTGYTLQAMGTDAIIMRHSISGAPKFLAERISIPVINAGDGTCEHPTQALLDMLTMKRHFGRIQGLKVALIGDIKYSRVARSNIAGLTKLGAQVSVFGPSTLIPPHIEAMGARVAASMEEALQGANVVMGLRLQLERQQKGLIPSISEYSKYFSINEQRLSLCEKDCIVMHPGPKNRGVEISDEVCMSERSLINDQVTNGLCIRMAILERLIGEKK